jgi:predicted alpha/beta-hydrolase family hydrolase
MEAAVEQNGVSGILHTPANPNGDVCALTHGAGSNCRAPLLAAAARTFAEAGYQTLRYDLPFRQQGRKGPPLPAMAAKDRAGIEAAIALLREMAPGARVIAGGHSYGGRQTSMAAAEHHGMADQLLLLSYPLHPPDKPEKLRTDHFPALRTPARFVHGAKDPFGTEAELRAALALIPAKTELILVPGAGHDLKNLKDLTPLTRW